MTEQKVSMAIAFMQSHPADAAEILEQHPAREVAAFLASIPIDCATIVMGKMLPQYVAGFLKIVEISTAARFLLSLEIKQIVGIIRNFDLTFRDSLLNELPTKIRLGCAFFLNYSQEMVGAWCTPNAFVLTSSITVSEAINRIINTEEVTSAEYLFVINRDLKISGKLSVIRLLRTDPDQILSTMPLEKCHALSARMLIKEAFKHPDWVSSDILPVVNRNKEFIGILRHTDLRQSLERQVKIPDLLSEPPLLVGIGEGYSQTLLALLRSMKEIVQSEGSAEGSRST